MEAVRRLISRVGPQNIVVEIFGEPGTGKELVAKALAALHNGEPPCAVNCAELAAASHLVLSILRGHERGAFTGADERRIGLLEDAGRRTLFFDEIGELPPEIQAALLRILQERVSSRLGSRTTFPVLGRFVFATHKDLDCEVAARRMRPDFRGRIRGVPIRLPPLRERKGDIADIIEHHLRGLNATLRFSPASMEALWEHDWPENVRELLHAVEVLLAVADGPVIQPKDLFHHTSIKPRHRGPTLRSVSPPAADAPWAERLATALGDMLLSGEVEDPRSYTDAMLCSEANALAGGSKRELMRILNIAGRTAQRIRSKG